MYFGTKNYLKSTRNHTVKYVLTLSNYKYGSETTVWKYGENTCMFIDTFIMKARGLAYFIHHGENRYCFLREKEKNLIAFRHF